MTAIQDEPSQKIALRIDFWLELPTGDFLPLAKGTLRFEDGVALREAATWLGIRLDVLLYRAITDCLAEVQAAMDEEQTGIS